MNTINYKPVTGTLFATESVIYAPSVNYTLNSKCEVKKFNYDSLWSLLLSLRGSVRKSNNLTINVDLAVSSAQRHLMADRAVDVDLTLPVYTVTPATRLSLTTCTAGLHVGFSCMGSSFT